MSKKDKLIKKFLKQGNDFEYSELVSLLKYLGFREVVLGKTTGSAVCFENERGINMKDYLEYKGYLGTVEYSKEDDCLCGKVIGIRGAILYEGVSLEELKKDFHDAVDDYLEMCRKRKIIPEQAFKGSFNIRIGTDLHRDVALCAQEKNMTINSFIKEVLSRAVANV